MKTKWGLGLSILLIIAMLCACGPTGATIELGKEFISSDGYFTLNAPDDWFVYDALEKDDLAMAIWNYDTAYTSVYFYDKEYYDDDLDAWLSDLKTYYGENKKGKTKELTINDMKAYAFEYSMEDLSEYGDTYNYHGFEYLIHTPYGIVEVDTNYAQGVLEGKVFDPSDDDLKLITRIAETFKIN